MNAIKTTAIVLHRTDFGEADRIVQFLTPNGKIGAMVKGARKEKSRLAGGIELFSICEIVYVQGKGELVTLTSSRLCSFLGNIIKDYDRLQFGYVVLKLISKASDSIDERDWFDILSEVLLALNIYSISLEMIQTWFFLRYSIMFGNELSLYSDVNGDKILEGVTYRYNQAERGLEVSGAGLVNSEHIKLLRLINSKSIITLSKIGGIVDVLSVCQMTAREHASI